MERTCVRCGDPAGKGRHYVTVKTSERTTRLEFACCDGCGPLLHTDINDTVTKWRRKDGKK